MNPVPAVKKIFGFFAFFDTERTLRQYQELYFQRETGLKNKVRSQELQIQQMEQKLSASVVENLDQARKSHCYLHQLKDQLAKTLCEKNEYRHKYEQIKMTHQSLVEFLEKNRSHLPFSHPQ